MKLVQVLNEASIPENVKSSFDNIFARIKNQVKASTNIDVTPKWVAGMLNQFHNFKYLDKIRDSHKKNNNEAAATDIEARIAARDVLAKLGLLDKTNGYLPKQRQTLSLMRQYYTDDIHVANQEMDAAKSTRVAGEEEYQEWFNKLSDEHKNYVKNLQELNPDELAGFKHVIRLQKHKKEFMTKLHEWAKGNDVAITLLKNIGLITPEGRLSAANTEKLREFLKSLSNARLKDVISKASVYAGKKITHDEHRAKNAVLKGLEKNPRGTYSKMLKVYDYITSKIGDAQDKDRAFRRALDKLPAAHSDGQPNLIGKGAYKLHKMFGGKKIDFDTAIRELDKAYRFPADRTRRAAKSETRGETIKDVSEI